MGRQQKITPCSGQQGDRFLLMSTNKVLFIVNFCTHLQYKSHPRSRMSLLSGGALCDADAWGGCVCCRTASDLLGILEKPGSPPEVLKIDSL